MRATNQQELIIAVFEAAERATDSPTHLVPDLDRGSRIAPGQGTRNLPGGAVYVSAAKFVHQVRLTWQRPPPSGRTARG